MKPVVFHPEAEVEFAAAVSFYCERRLELATDFAEEVIKAITFAAANPQAGTRVPVNTGVPPRISGSLWTTLAKSAEAMTHLLSRNATLTKQATFEVSTPPGYRSIDAQLRGEPEDASEVASPLPARPRGPATL